MSGEAFDPELIDWSLTTWEGSRAEQLRRWRKMSFDEILAAQEAMAELVKRESEGEARWAKNDARTAESPGRAGKEPPGDAEPG